MKLSQFKYPLPKNLIAKNPKIPRDAVKMMVVDNNDNSLESKKLKNIVDYMNEGDVIVLNDSKVFPSRLFGTKEKTRAKIEVFLLRQLNLEENVWDVVVDPARKVRIGNRIFFNKSLFCEIIDNTTSRGRIVRYNVKEDFKTVIEKLGKTPLPFYIKRESDDKDKEYYQTVFAKNVGSVAAPAAGINFTKEILKKIESKGVKVVYITLHIGLGTFRIVEVEDLSKHRMDSEYYSIPVETAHIVNEAINKKKNIFGVGTSVVRALESSVITGKHVRASTGWTDRFIHPPHGLSIVNKLVTKIHPPQSTHLMLSCSLAERDLIMKAYKKAIKEKYKFLAYGDLILIV